MTGADLKGATLILHVLTREGDDDALAAIAEELTLADAYRDARCTTQSQVVVVIGNVAHTIGDDTNCVGENHAADCPGELAKQDWWSAQDRRRSL